MTDTVNFTGSVDRDLLKRAKVIAAQSDTSVNALFNAELRHLVETYEAAQACGNQNFVTLLDFSLGRIVDLIALARLGLVSEEDLFLLMAQAHLPMPRLSERATRAIAYRSTCNRCFPPRTASMTRRRSSAASCLSCAQAKASR